MDEYISSGKFFLDGEPLGEVDLSGFTWTEVPSIDQSWKTLANQYTATVTVTFDASEGSTDLWKSLYSADWASDERPRTNEDRAFDLSALVPGLQEEVARPCGEKCAAWARTVRDIIVHLNDFHNATSVQNAEKRGLKTRDLWTREDIADWLDTLDIDLRVSNNKEED